LDRSAALGTLIADRIFEICGLMDLADPHITEQQN
jgi:hypothetical protein